MSDQEWLKWIKPAPKGAEVQKFNEDLQSLVGLLESFVAQPPEAKMRAFLNGMLPDIEALKGRVRLIPVEKRFLANFQNIISPIESLDREVRERLSILGPAEAHRPTKEIKALCIALCMGFLKTRGKRHGRHSNGPVVGLSMWVWEAAGGEPSSGVHAWRDLAKHVAIQAEKNETENHA